MITPVYLATLLLLLVGVARTDAKQADEKGEAPASRRCYQCSPRWQDCARAEQCPPAFPHCATVATSPNFTSYPTCAALAAPAASRPCSLTYSEKYSYKMICTCSSHLCNAPFSRELHNELIIFSAVNIPNNSTTDYIDIFWNKSQFANVSNSQIYKKIIVKTQTITPPTFAANLKFALGTYPKKEVLPTVASARLPTAEAFKQQTMLPSDDDEDEGEGSGAEEEQEQPPPAAPAAPHSRLPAAAAALASAPPLLAALPAALCLLLHEKLI